MTILDEVLDDKVAVNDEEISEAIVLLLERDAGEAHSVRWVIDASASCPGDCRRLLMRD